MGSYVDLERAPAPHRLLSLDGGGIRGVLTLEVLARIEAVLGKEQATDNFVLADWFDYIGGTSTGAIIAAGLSRGMAVAEIQELYERLGPEMFKKRLLPRRIWALYGAKPLTAELKKVFGEDTTFGDPSLRTLLMMVLRNASTDSPWPLSNVTSATFNQAGPGCNLDLPLWQLVRASTAAPLFFPAEEVEIDGRAFRFEDGGVTSYNNPAFQLFLMATIDAYNLSWQTGERELLLVSVGTGFRPNANENLKLSRRHFVYNAKAVPKALMFASMTQQDVLCRVFGRCLVGGRIDRELKDLHAEQAVTPDKLFTYLRYDAALDDDGLARLGFPDIDSVAVSKLDAVDHADDLKRIGQRVAEDVDIGHYLPFGPVRPR
jgi:hypothetical protein